MPTFKRSLPMILNYALDSVLPIHRELFARYGLTEQQWRVLRVLWNSERTTAMEVSRAALLPAPSLVGILDRLEKKELVSRVRSVEDRRNVFIIATAQGRALQKEVQPLVESIQAYLKSLVTQSGMDGPGIYIGKH